MDTPTQAHKAGFVSILGKPNAGKSTFMNQVLGEKLAIISPKAQTTRHRIMGILSDENYQIIYSDTPGIIEPKYELHQKMMHFVQSSLEDADLIVFVTDMFEKHDESDVIELLKKVSVPIILLINKIDLAEQEQVKEKAVFWEQELNPYAIIPISALHGFNVSSVLEMIIERLPEHPAYFPKDNLTDRPARFFASEIVREKIFLNYSQEIPYCTEVAILSFKEQDNLLVIHADIFVERKSQKGIIIGKGGEMLRKVGTDARLDMERFFGKKIYLHLFVKVEPNWRRRSDSLKSFGYKH